MKKHIKVYIIIINYGEPDHSIECLQSILENSYEFFHVVIVDVSNINHSVKKLNSWIEKKKDSRFTLIHENNNKGFAFANNIGIKHSIKQDDCDYLWILNNDTIIDKNCLNNLVNCCEEFPNTSKLGIVGSKVMDYNNPDSIQSIGGIFNPWTRFPDWIGAGEIDKGQYDDQDLKIDHIIGASMFLKKSLINYIGLMPEDYFLYFEDTDWCINTQRAGFQNLICYKSVVYHKQGASTGVKYLNDKKHLQNKKYFYINLLKLYRKYFKLFLPMAYLFLLKKMAGNIYRGNYNEAKLLSKVILNIKPN